MFEQNDNNDEVKTLLEKDTTASVNKSWNKLEKNITIIIIAHRLNTIKKCNIIFKLENGVLIGQGSYDELIKTSNNQLNL